MNLSARTKQVLLDGGWHENRSTDISKYVSELERAGLKVFESAQKFLSEYGELTLRPPIDPPPQVDFLGNIHFRPDYPSFNDREREALERFANESVYPVGSTGVNFNLFITPRSRFALSDLDWTILSVLGESTEEALEAMCDGRYCRVGGVLLNEELNPVGTFPAFVRSANS